MLEMLFKKKKYFNLKKCTFSDNTPDVLDQKLVQSEF